MPGLLDKEKKVVVKKSAKGAIGELTVAIDYMKKGYWVALAVDPHSPFDLIVVDDDGNCTLIDSKCFSIRATGRKGTKIYRNLNKKQKEMGVKLKYVDCD